MPRGEHLRRIPRAERGKVADLGLVAKEYWDDPKEMEGDLTELSDFLYRFEALPRPVLWLLSLLGVLLYLKLEGVEVR